MNDVDLDKIFDEGYSQAVDEMITTVVSNIINTFTYDTKEVLNAIRRGVLCNKKILEEKKLRVEFEICERIL